MAYNCLPYHLPRMDALQRLELPLAPGIPTEQVSTSTRLLCARLLAVHEHVCAARACVCCMGVLALWPGVLRACVCCMGVGAI